MTGMLTFREVLQAVHRAGREWADMEVGDAMLASPMRATPDMEMDALRRLMIDHHQRYLPVMDGDTLMGVVSFHDVAKAVLEEQSFENRMLKNYIRNWPEEDKAD
jgi:CBS domain-containing protein